MSVYGNTSTYGESPSYGDTDSTEPSTTDQVKDKATEVKDQVKDKAGEVKDKIGEYADTARDRVRDTAADQIDSRSTDAGASLAGVAEQARGVGDDLRDRGSDTAARLVDQAAGYTDRLADYLRSADATTILNDAEAFARRQPWAVVVGGLVAGFAASRILRASRPTSDPSRPTVGGAAYGTGYTTTSGTYPATAGVNEPIFAEVGNGGGYGSPIAPLTGETGRDSV